MMIVFHILALLLRDAAFRVLLQVGCFFRTMERRWLERNAASGVVSNSAK
jgi:hypothetical protein